MFAMTDADASADASPEPTAAMTAVNPRVRFMMAAIRRWLTAVAIDANAWSRC